MKEFMLQWQEGQEYLITAKKLRFRYEHGIMNGKYRKTVDRELTVRQFEMIRHNPDNGHYSFFYNGERQFNISIDTASNPNLVIIRCRDRFPGYEPGHPADQQRGDTPLAAPLHSNEAVAGGRSDRHYQRQHQGFQPASGCEHRSENQLSTEEPSLGFVERLIRESIQVIPLELVRIDKPAVVLVRVPETGEENRYMMTLSPIARS